jgi:hypothetical protein
MESNRKSRKTNGRAKLIIAALAVVVMAALVAVLVFQQIEIRRLNDPAASAE